MRKILLCLSLALCSTISTNAQGTAKPLLGQTVVVNDQNHPVTVAEMPKPKKHPQTGFSVFDLPKLPYQLNELQPVISETAMMYHYGKHTLAYMNNVNDLLVGTKFQTASLEDMIRDAEGPLFNNAAQFWNHSFYFSSMMPPKENNIPQGNLLAAIEKQWGSFDNFKTEFAKKANSVFGSGWVWLVKGKNGKLEIVQTSNADNPMRNEQIPILCLDVWEHAYYTDYFNKRADFVNGWWSLVDWEKVGRRL